MASGSRSPLDADINTSSDEPQQQEQQQQMDIATAVRQIGAILVADARNGFPRLTAVIDAVLSDSVATASAALPLQQQHQPWVPDENIPLTDLLKFYEMLGLIEDLPVDEVINKETLRAKLSAYYMQ